VNLGDVLFPARHDLANLGLDPVELPFGNLHTLRGVTLFVVGFVAAFHWVEGEQLVHAVRDVFILL